MSTEMARMEATGISSFGTSENQSSSLVRTEVETQALIARRFPRDTRAAFTRIADHITSTVETAGLCVYDKPVGDGKNAQGGSIRMAEIVAQNWGNIAVDVRVIEIGDASLTARAVVWDLETNVKISQEHRESILMKNGGRRSPSQINVTANAACSKAFRNAIFRLVGRTIEQSLLSRAQAVASGKSPTSTAVFDAKQETAKLPKGQSIAAPKVRIDDIATLRERCLAAWEKVGVVRERVLSVVGKAKADELTHDDIAKLRGFYTAIAEGDVELDDVIPPVLDQTTTVETRRKRQGRNTASVPESSAPQPPPEPTIEQETSQESAGEMEF